MSITQGCKLGPYIFCEPPRVQRKKGTAHDPKPSHHGPSGNEGLVTQMAVNPKWLMQNLC